MKPFTTILLLSLVIRSLPAAEEQAQSEVIHLTTTDGVLLRCTYYPGSAGKETVPVILVHGWKGPRGAGSGRDFDGLAEELQAASHAVIVPDLRGHGASTMRRSLAGTRRSFRRDRLGPRDFNAMVRHDIETVKKFLVSEHNRGHLNIELLTVVGAEMGAAVAANWAAHDWSWPMLPNLKQGQDVKALVLISPTGSFRNLSLRKALKFKPLSSLPTMIIHGAKHETAQREAERLHKQLQPFHRNSEDDRYKTLFLVGEPTSLQGTSLLESELDTGSKIATFLEYRLVAQRSRLPWRPRT